MHTHTHVAMIHTKCNLKRHAYSESNNSSHECSECPVSTNLNVNQVKTGSKTALLVSPADPASDVYLVHNPPSVRSKIQVGAEYYSKFTVVFEGNCYTARGNVSRWFPCTDPDQWTFELETSDFLLTFYYNSSSHLVRAHSVKVKFI